jgi:aminopeptidase N
MAGIDWDFDALHQHELSHEWYGNMVAPYDWGDIWLNEGPAQYAQILYAEYALTEDKVYDLLSIYRTTLSNHQPVVSPKGSTFRQAYNNDIYFKGALVLHSLRYLMGDDQFFELLHRWTYPDPESEKATDCNNSRFASTKDFIRLAEKVHGEELDWFFDVYLFSAPLPELITESRENIVKLFWKAPDDLPFHMPIDVQIGEEIKQLQMKDGVEVIMIPDGAEYVIDPTQWVLKK